MLEGSLDETVHWNVGFHEGSFRLDVYFQHMRETAGVYHRVTPKLRLTSTVRGSMIYAKRSLLVVEVLDARGDVGYLSLVAVHGGRRSWSSRTL